MNQIGSVVAWAVVFSASLARAADDPLGELVQKALESKGPDYFAAKAKILAQRDGAASIAEKLLAKQDSTLEQKLLGKALLESLKSQPQGAPDPLADDLLMRIALASRAFFAVNIKGPGPGYGELFRMDPKEVPKESRYYDLLHTGTDHVGLLAELLNKQDSESWASVTVHAYYQQHEATIKERTAKAAKASPQTYIDIPRHQTPAEIRTWIGERGYAASLQHAREIAMRALVTSDAREAVPLLKQRATERDTAKTAVECLIWIKSEAAQKALAELKTTDPTTKAFIEKIESPPMRDRGGGGGRTSRP